VWQRRSAHHQTEDERQEVSPGRVIGILGLCVAIWITRELRRVPRHASKRLVASLSAGFGSRPRLLGRIRVLRQSRERFFCRCDLSGCSTR